MSEPHDPAFPITGTYGNRARGITREEYHEHLRYLQSDAYWRKVYAGQALQGLLARGTFEHALTENATEAVLLADALLAALKEKETP